MTGLDDFKDIIDKPYVKSKLHPNMPIEDRAAQFSAFAALTGYEDAIDKTRLSAEERYEHEYEDSFDR